MEQRLHYVHSQSWGLSFYGARHGCWTSSIALLKRPVHCVRDEYGYYIFLTRPAATSWISGHSRGLPQHRHQLEEHTSVVEARLNCNGKRSAVSVTRPPQLHRPPSSAMPDTKLRSRSGVLGASEMLSEKRNRPDQFFLRAARVKYGDKAVVDRRRRPLFDDEDWIEVLPGDQAALDRFHLQYIHELCTANINSHRTSNVARAIQFLSSIGDTQMK
nr:hypothetical protein Iba_chr02dCG4890 [Ipomoea batatas]